VRPDDLVKLIFSHDAKLDCSALALDARPVAERAPASFQHFTVAEKGFVVVVYRGEDEVQAFRRVEIEELRAYLRSPQSAGGAEASEADVYGRLAPPK
jgi:hypothetical protein